MQAPHFAPVPYTSSRAGSLRTASTPGRRPRGSGHRPPQREPACVTCHPCELECGWERDGAGSCGEMATQAQNAVKEIRDAEWTCFPSAGRSELQMWLLSGMLLHSDCVSCKPKAPSPPVSSPQSRRHWHLPSRCLISVRRIFCIINPLMKKGRESP